MAITVGKLSVDILARVAGGEPVVIGTAELPITSTADGVSIDDTALRGIFRTKGE